MKKNIMMRLSALLLVAVLLTTCVISGTFAKYTTTYSATDKATVAAWGIKLTVEGEDVLYDDNKKDTELATSVKAAYLAAPGTYQKLATVNLTGTPEVAYKIVVDVDLELENWTAAGGFYCPLVFSVDENPVAGSFTNAEDLEAAVEKAVLIAIAGGNATSATASGKGLKYEVEYNAGTAVATGAADGVVVDWLWAFNGEDAGEDAKDTELGNATTKATIDFKLTVTVEQVEKTA